MLAYSGVTPMCRSEKRNDGHRPLPSVGLTCRSLRDLEILILQWNPSITDTIGHQHFVPYSEVSLAQGLPVYFR